MNQARASLYTGIRSPQSRAHYQNYLLLLLVCLLAYWPLTFGIFSVKNDAIHYFLPYRYSISEAIRNGEWPFWSPYIYMGYPVSGDMQSGAWNPVVWIFSLIGRYDLTLFHYENLLYIFLAGAGMYKLTSRLTENKTSSLLIAVSYMLSGFMLSGQLINWLASAAFIPFVIHYYTLLLKSGSYSTAIKTALSLFLLFTAGYPSFLIVTAYILAGLFVIKIIAQFRQKKDQQTSWKSLLLSHLLLLIVWAAVSLPAILSYLDLLHYYQRGDGISYTDSVINSYDRIHFQSFIFPSTISAADIRSGADVSLRNVYMGLLPLLLLLRFPPLLNRRNILLISLGLFALLFSLGDATPVRKFCFDYLPLMNTFRHPAQLRLFLILSLLLLAAPGLKQLILKAAAGNNPGFFKKELLIYAGLILSVTGITVIQYGFPDFTHFFSGTGTGSFKTLLGRIRLNDAIVLNGLVQLLFLAGFFLWLKNRNTRFFSLLWISNGIVLAQFVLPVSFVSSHSPSAINAFIRQQPSGYPPDYCDSSLSVNSAGAMQDFDLLSLRSFYNKLPGISRLSNSPSFLTTTEEFLSHPSLYQYVASKPIIYFAGRTLALKDSALLNNPDSCKYAISVYVLPGTVDCSATRIPHVTALSANRFQISCPAGPDNFLVLTQNYHAYWKATIDKTPVRIYKTNLSFMGIPVPRGEHTVIFEFDPAPVKKAIWVMTIVFILLVTGGIFNLFRQVNSKKA
ncbi:MAG: hypothetical protein HYZ15_11705 [Sphingobacteriales bacterium]|nr:hypothetical protein [Sphingobacteriales bacterium]